jgi:lysophospholipase L1-like esterase
MSLLQRMSRLAVVPLGAMVFVQGRRLRRDTPRLPDAALPWTGLTPVDGAVGAETAPLRMLVLGDSTAAGVGADTQDDALPGMLARELVARWNRPIAWRAIGENGATALDLRKRFIGDATTETYDFIFLSVGANDALGLRPRWAFGRDIRALLTQLREANPEATIMMSSLPAFTRFVLLPNPLRWNLYLHSQSLEAEARGIVAGLPRTIMSPPPPPYTDGFFASDLFHPSAQGYRDWARFAIEDAFSTGQLR